MSGFRGCGLLRRCVAAAAALALAAGTPSPASAQDIARVGPEAESGATIRLEGGDAAKTSLYRLMVDEDTAVAAYCADISTSVNPRAAYTESSWDADSAPAVHAAAPAALNWITAHSYPSVDLERLREESGVPGVNQAQAIAATQAAVWHHTNGIDLAQGPGRGSAGNAAPMRELYDYLLEGARLNAGAEPEATLALTPGRVERADPAAPIGPFTVHTTSPGPVAVWVGGARNGQLTGPGGEPVEQVGDGGEFFLRLPPQTPTGVATVYARVTDARVRPGRLFVGKDGVQTQPLVAADTAATGATAAVKVDWVSEEAAAEERPEPESPGTEDGDQDADEAAPPAPSASPAQTPAASPTEVVVAEDRRPEDNLARTGTWLGTILIVGLALVAVGAAVLYLTRRSL
ncbi:TQXA domain-containing protein [Streptomonospora sp. PA3]|uniref:thioester domain-containing protein n=1 Tax=Streptomonospora sp. PA3 TaxID=2607326 RepID=UPI0012DFE81D|nr:thioester domain-containing protein [Streptomonospora sp. PA3]MUL42699.1 TQXA domain-containing protein [Streptomonospora sp. PA3]